MPSVLAWCPTHGPFDSGIYFENATNVTLGGGLSECPRCGHLSPMMEGTFDFVDETVRVLSAPSWTIAKLKRMRSALLWAQAHLPDDEEEALRQVEAVDPAVGGTVRRWWASLDTGQRIAVTGIATSAGISLLSVLIAMLNLLATERRVNQGQVSEDRVRQIAEKVLTDEEMSRATPPPPAPSPSSPARTTPAPTSAPSADARQPPPATQR